MHPTARRLLLPICAALAFALPARAADDSRTAVHEALAVELPVAHTETALPETAERGRAHDGSRGDDDKNNGRNLRHERDEHGDHQGDDKHDGQQEHEGRDHEGGSGDVGEHGNIGEHGSGERSVDGEHGGSGESGHGDHRDDSGDKEPDHHH